MTQRLVLFTSDTVTPKARQAKALAKLAAGLEPAIETLTALGYRAEANRLRQSRHRLESLSRKAAR